MGKTRALLLAAALAAAAVAAWLAPAAWPDGEPRVEVDYAGDGAVSTRLEPGSPVRVFVRVERDGAAVRPDPAALRVDIVLADGRRALVPLARWDAAAQTWIAQRRAPESPRLALALLAAVVLLWITEAIPLWVTSLLVPIVLAASGAVAARDALAPFFHPIIALFFGGFLMAEAMRRAGLDRRIALGIVAYAGRSARTLFFALLGTSAFLSMWMSNTASAALLVPIAIAITEPLGHLGYRKAIVLGIAYAATLGGAGSAIGTPANPIAMEFLESFAGRSVSFAGWFAYGLPMVVCFLPLLGVYLWWRAGIRIEAGAFEEAQSTARAQLDELGGMSREEKLVLAVFGGVMVLWLTPWWHGLHTGIVALLGVVVLALLNRLDTDDLARISWSSLLTFGGGLALGEFLVHSGTSDWMATQFAGLSGAPALLGVGATAFFALALTAVASNTASAAILVPLAIPLSSILGVDPTLLVMVVAIASSIDFALVIGTPPTMVAFSTRLYTAREIFKTGIVLDIVGVTLLVTVVVELWRWFGLVG